jgi:hypothetical protein
MVPNHGAQIKPRPSNRSAGRSHDGRAVTDDYQAGAPASDRGRH